MAHARPTAACVSSVSNLLAAGGIKSREGIGHARPISRVKLCTRPDVGSSVCCRRDGVLRGSESPVDRCGQDVMLFTRLFT